MLSEPITKCLLQLSVDVPAINCSHLDQLQLLDQYRGTDLKGLQSILPGFLQELGQAFNQILGQVI
ncbi:conserved hypothetical protein [Pseudomonas sp. 8Z]|nr:conserved hypothetical protein [Pseudomonas sp. 8Z]